MTDNIVSKKNVLLVDDDEVHNLITETSLKDDYNIFSVKSGKEALEFLANIQNIPDLIILDILMPEMDGWVVFDKIHNIASLKFIPIIFFTSLDEESAKEKAYEMGALDYIVKPCEQKALLERIGKTLEKSELQKKQYDK